MTEKRFKEIISIETIVDNKTGLHYKPIMLTDDFLDLINELAEENEQLRLQLNLCSDQRNEFHRGARENANRVGKLEKENEQLRKQLQNFQ